MNASWPWPSIEIAKLVIAALTPIAVAILGLYLTRLAKRSEHNQWRNQRLIEKRIVVYDDLAPHLNDLLCYFTFVGCWKDLNPPDVVAMKRLVDKKIYLAAPLFPEIFFSACSRFVGLCFSTFQGWGQNATLRTPIERRKQAAGDAWEQGWNDCFSNDVTNVEAIRSAYQEIMSIFSREIGLNPSCTDLPIGDYPANIR